MEIITGVLTDEEFRRQLVHVADFFMERGVTHAGVAFGFAIEHPDLEDVGVYHEVPVAQISSFIAERERTKGFQLGSEDCWVRPTGLDAEFLFCNDRDVHLTSSSAEVLNSMRLHWRSQGFGVYPDDLPHDA